VEKLAKSDIVFEKKDSTEYLDGTIDPPVRQNSPDVILKRNSSDQLYKTCIKIIFYYI
jgi:hypothetical protein